MVVGVNWLTLCQECHRAVFWPIIVPPIHLRAFSIPENKLIGYANDSTLIAVVISPGLRVAAAESLNHDLVKVSDWCDLWGMKLNACKTKTMSLQVTHNASPITCINYWWNCAEGV